MSLLVAILGTTYGFDEAYSSFRHAWWALAAVAVVAAVVALGMTPKVHASDQSAVTTFQTPDA